MTLTVNNKVYTTERVVESYNMEFDSSNIRLEIFLADDVAAPAMNELTAAFEAIGTGSFTVENNEPVTKTFSGYTVVSITNDMEEQSSNYCVLLTKPAL